MNRILDDVAELKGGFAFKSKDYSDNGRFILRTVNIGGDGRITKEGATYIPEGLAPEYERFELQNHDTLFVMVGATLGKVGYVAQEDLPALLNQNMWVIRSRNEEVCDPRFLNYWFRSVVGSTLQWASGSARGFVRRDDYRNIPFPEFDIEEQRQTATVLAALDDKIALNRKLNETLEGMARALFQSWFVDFDPVKAKLAAVRHGRDPERACMAALSGKLRIAPGKPKLGTPTSPSASVKEKADGDVGAPRGLPTAEELDTAIGEIESLSPSQQENLAQTASHFPANFQESELGLVPEGWEASEIGKEVSIFGGATPSTKEEKFWDGENAWATPKDLSGIPSKVLISTDRQITDEGVKKISSGQLPVGTVLMSSRAPVGYLAQATIPISINQGFIAMVCDNKLPNSYVLLWAEAVMEEIKSNASGSTFAEISKKAFRPIRVIVPSTAVLETFSQTVSGFYLQITSNEHQSRTLAELRDTLLPKLLSGELTVGEASNTVEAAVES